jgi:GTP diphosphokinase / guanosine-3',5'-bis(diphosphate) 3'-diphosphatase
MHDLAEEGIAAHWRYKEGGYNSGDAARFEWLRRMMDTQKELDDSGEYMDAVRLDLFSDEVYVFTPKGDVVELPNGATPLDLAFHIHTDLGLQCVGAKVNGVMVPLRHKLKSGDAIEILRSKTAKPNKDWLKFVTTARAKSKIRSFLRIEQRAKSLELGEEILEREAQKHDVGLARLKKTDDLNKVAPQFKAKDTEELYRLIGIGKVDPKQVLKALVPELNIEEQPKERSALGKLFDKVTRKNVRSGIEVQGIDDMLTHLAKCCNPIPGDPVVGFVTRGRGVVVHRKDCPRCQDYDPERKVDVRWVGDSNNRHKVGVRVITQNQPGVLANISAVFSKAGININEANCRTFADQRAVNDFTVDVGNLDQLRQVIIDIERLKGVVTAERIPSK